MGQKFDKWSYKNIVKPFAIPVDNFVEGVAKNVWSNKGNHFL